MLLSSKMNRFSSGIRASICILHTAARLIEHMAEHIAGFPFEHIRDTLVCLLEKCMHLRLLHTLFIAALTFGKKVVSL